MIGFSPMKCNEKAFRSIANMAESATRGLKRGALLSGKDIRHEIRRKLAAPKHGKVYYLPDVWTGLSVRHRASAPGEAPARFSGSLKASVNYVARGDELIIGAGTGGRGIGLVYDAGYPGQIGFGRIVDYAASLELNENRPYLKSTVEERQRNTWIYLLKSISRELHR